MASLGNMLGAAVFFAAAAHRAAEAEREGLAKAAKIIEDGAKEAIGSFLFGWPALKPETVSRKATGNSPLLETGELRNSISHEVSEHSAIVGSTSEKARFHEFGTSRGIPPRPFIWGSWLHNQEKVGEAVGDAVVKRLGL